MLPVTHATSSGKVLPVNEHDQPAAAPQENRPAAPSQAQRPRGDRAARIRHVLTSRAAGWVTAAVLAGAVAALAAVDATAPSPPVVPAVFRVARPGFAGLPPGAGPAQMPILISPGRRFAGSPRAIRVRLGTVVPVFPGGPFIRPDLASGLGPALGRGELTTPFGNLVAGTAGAVSRSGFTIMDGSRTVTVHEQSTTVYRRSGRPAPASAVTRGAHVAVLGSLSGSVLTANLVAVLS